MVDRDELNNGEVSKEWTVQSHLLFVVHDYCSSGFKNHRTPVISSNLTP